MGLAATFLGLIGTLHSHISPDAVAAFADRLEHFEQRVADLEIQVTGKVAEFVEKVVAPAPAAEPAAAVVGAAIDAGALLAQLAQLLAAHKTPAPAPGPGTVPPAGPAPESNGQG